MHLFDSLHINNSGGKVLLEFLLNKLGDNKSIYYVFDSRLSGVDEFNKYDKSQFLKPQLIKRFLFYQKHNKGFDKIFCFANIPPLSKQKALTYTYFHQIKFLSNYYDVTFYEQVRLFFQKTLLKYLSKNTDYFIVQSSYMAMQLSYKLDFDINKILVLPFYPPLNSNNNSNFLKEKNTFLYVSGGALHKNHIRLIDAFASFYIKNKKGTLFITISNPSKKLDNLIQDYKKKHIPIINLGEMPRENLVEYYQKSEYLIYPSLAESFGLGLIEGLEFECKVIGADLPYTYEVCEPSLVFNPFDVADIENAFHVASTTKLPLSIKKIENKIDELIQLFNLDTTPPR